MQSLDMMRRARVAAVLIAISFALAACSDACSGPPPDAGTPNPEPEPADAGAPPDDAGVVPDAGSDVDGGSGFDAGPLPGDAGPPPVDAGPGSGFGTVIVEAFSLGDAPVEDGSVTFGDTTLPLVSGSATFTDVPIGRSVFRVDADGFAPGVAVVEVSSDITHYTPRLLLPVAARHTFDATAPLDIAFRGARVQLPANALVDESGAAVTGDVELLLTPLDPTTTLAGSPGPLEGVDTTDAVVPMESFFMADIRFRQGDQALQLADGESADLELVLPPDIGLATSATVPAWWFDEEEGRWREEGTGTVIDRGGMLVWQATVEHFTFWNADAALENTSCVQVRVLDDVTGNAVVGVPVSTIGTSYLGATGATTVLGGYACMDFQRASTARVIVSSDEGFADPLDVSGDGAGASCSTGGCQNVEIRLEPPACIEGQVTEGGASVEGARVVASFDDNRFTSAVSAADGTFCVPVRQGTAASLRVTKRATNGTLLYAAALSTAPDEPGACGGGACGQAPPLDLAPAPTFCMKGNAVSDAGGAGSDIPVPAGTEVILFRSGTFTGKDCAAPPSQWGEILGAGVVNGDGSYCLDALLDDDNSYIAVANTCALGLNECEAQFPPGYCRTTSDAYRDPGTTQTAVGGSCLVSTDACLDIELYFSDPA